MGLSARIKITKNDPIAYLENNYLHEAPLVKEKNLAYVRQPLDFFDVNLW